MRKVLAIITAISLAASFATAVDHTGQSDFDAIIGVGGQSKDIDITVNQSISRHAEFSDTLTNGRGWVYMDFPIKSTGEGLLTPDVWLIEFACDSCQGGADVAEVRIVSGTDSLECYRKGMMAIYQPGDSTATDLIQRIAIQNPHPDTTAAGNTATFTYSYFKAD